MDAYVEATGLTSVRSHLDYYRAFACFRMGSILQGVYKRSLSGQASAADGAAVGKLASVVAQLGVPAADRYTKTSARDSPCPHPPRRRRATRDPESAPIASASREPTEPPWTSYAEARTTVGRRVRRRGRIESAERRRKRPVPSVPLRPVPPIGPGHFCNTLGETVWNRRWASNAYV